MKKISLLILDKYRQESLFDLRRLGLLHIKYKYPPSSASIDSLKGKIEDAERGLSILSAYASSEKQAKAGQQAGMFDYAAQIISLAKQGDDCLADIENIKNKISWYEDWGRFSLKNLQGLTAAGVYIRLYKCSGKELENLKKKAVSQVIKKQGNTYYVAAVSLDRSQDTGLQEVTPPDADWEVLQRELSAAESRLSDIESSLKVMAGQKKQLQGHLAYLKKALDFDKVKSGMQQEGKICYLQGYMPKDKCLELVELARQKGWAYLIQEPDNPQEVPTLIKNPRWLKIIEPVFKFMGTLPGYHEYDISFGFLLFFSLFFAMLIGDAGYGLIFLLLSYLIRKRIPQGPAEPFLLMYVLSVATVIWGALSGTWFGFEGIAQLPFFKGLVVNRLNSFSDVNQPFIMYICFLIGAAHLSLAHGIIAFRIINSLKALAQLGWILIIWSLFFIAGKLVLAKDLSAYTGLMLSLGAGLVLLFSYPQKNILKGILFALGDLPFKVINSFSDIISYLRLFAVGYATVAVAASFNEMAYSSGFANIWAGFISALILFLGHGLNIVLGLMAVIVHGIRLNMLEFSSHLGMQWSGFEYRPFRE